MATASWVAELDKKERKNWVMVGCALNIAKNGITQLIQGKMEAWYHSLISSPPLQSLAPCTCVPRSPKCGTCVIWETEVKRYHKSKRPMICWDNSDRKQWGSPIGAWDVAKLFMPTLGRRKTQVIDAETTDIGGLLNLLEWCPFINPMVSRTVLSLARDQCRNHWAHAPKQELQDADVNIIFGHLNSLLYDPVFNADKAARKSSKDLQDLFHRGLVNVRESDLEALHLLRQSLVADLTKCGRDDLVDVQDKVVHLDADSKKVNVAVQNDMSDVKEQGDLNKEYIVKLRTEVHTARKDLTKCQDELDVKTKKVNESVQKDISEVKEQADLNKEEIVKLRMEVHTAREDLTKCQDELDVKTKKVNESVQKDISEVKEQGDLNTEEIVKLRMEVHTAREDLTECQDELDVKTKSVQRDISEVKKQGECSREEMAKLDTEVGEIKEEISMILNAVEHFNTQLKERDDLGGAIRHISEDVEYVRNGMQNVVMELTTTKSQVAELEVGLTSVRYEVKGVANEVATNTNTISGLQKHVMEVKEDVETLKAKPSQGQNDDDIDILCTAPSRLKAFTGRKSALEWLELNLVSDRSPEDCPGTSCCTKAMCGLGGCGKTSLAVEFTWRCTSNFPGGVFWINGESDENIRNSVVQNLALLNIPASTSEEIDDILNRFLALLSKKKLPWLLVVDNADELQDPTCPTGMKKICKGPWQRNGNACRLGHILFTTRQNAKATKTFLKLSSDDCLELQCFSEEEGALFLMQRTGSKGDSLDTDAISLLVNELGSLPLALEQAAAYISALPIPCSFKAYLYKYRAVKLRLLKQQSATALSVEAQHRLSVNTTWEINFEFVTEKSPAAATMMRIAAFLESENIPIDVINELVESRDPANSEIDIAAILKVLTSYSLFSVDQQRRVFSVHTLVQEVVRDSLTRLEKIETMLAATRVLDCAFKAKDAQWFKLPEFKGEGTEKITADQGKERDILIALLRNARKVENHMDEELKLSKEDSILDVLFNNKIMESGFVAMRFWRDNISFCRLYGKLTEFRLKVYSMDGADDPNLLLKMMIEASDAKLKCSISGSFKEAKKLSETTVKKLSEFEQSGVDIKADIKFDVLHLNASIYLFENQFVENYKALLELEGLSVSCARYILLQKDIVKAELVLSPCNFQSGLKRLQNALKAARGIYRPHDLKLLSLLKLITVLLMRNYKIQEAKSYAKEIMDICDKLPLPTNAHYMTEITSALRLIAEFDPYFAYYADIKLVDILKGRWPRIYSTANGDRLDDCQPIVDDGTEKYAAHVLRGLIECFPITREEKHEINVLTRNLTFYKTIAEILVSIQKAFHGEIHRAMEKFYQYQKDVHIQLGSLENDEEVARLNELIVKCQQSMYNEALILCPNDPQILTSIASTYLKSAEQKKDRPSERKSLLELALNNAEAATTADSTWLLGYYTKAASLAELDRKQQALAAAAVFKHLSSGRDVPGVAQRYGGLQVQVVESSDQLRCVFERIKELEGVNQVVLMKEGEYLLEKSVQISQQIVIVGQGQVTVSCKISAPFRFTQACHVENVLIIGDYDNNQEPQAQDCDTQSGVISLDTPSGYEHNECKVN